MQYAHALDDGRIWEAANFSKLSIGELENKRRNLVCAECGEFAWYRKESAHGHPAHFCAHHKDECSLRVIYEVINDPLDDASNVSDQVSSGDKIIVHLDKEKGGAIDVAIVQPPANGGQGGGTRFIRGGVRGESSQHFTLRRILHRLVSSPGFRESNSQILFYRNDKDVLLSGAVRDIVVEFSQINKENHHEKLSLFWGPVASAGFTQDGRLWLNSSSNQQDASVMVFEDIADDFLSLFDISDVQEDLLGAHVLVCGRCYFSASTGKPVIRCSAPKYIFVRRYRDQIPAASLRVELKN